MRAGGAANHGTVLTGAKKQSNSKDKVRTANVTKVDAVALKVRVRHRCPAAWLPWSVYARASSSQAAARVLARDHDDHDHLDEHDH